MVGDVSFELRPLIGTPGDLLEVQRVFESAPDYANAIQGVPFDALEATRTFTELPPGVDPSAKTVLGVYSNDELVGVVDLIDGFPVATTAMLGLLLIAAPTSARLGLEWCTRSRISDFVGACDSIRIGSFARTTGVRLLGGRGYRNGGERPWRRRVCSEIVVDGEAARLTGVRMSKRIQLTSGALDSLRGIRRSMRSHGRMHHVPFSEWRFMRRATLADAENFAGPPFFLRTYAIDGATPHLSASCLTRSPLGPSHAPRDASRAIVVGSATVP